MKVMVIGDTHLPFMHKNYLKFLKDTRDEYKPDLIVHIGDLVDNHALSFHDKDPDGLSAGGEWAETLKELKKFYKEFPEVIWITGNHDALPHRKAFKYGLPKEMLKSLKEMYQCPKGWTIVEETYIDDVLYTHGLAAGGHSGWQNFCIKQGCSVVFGHFHGTAGVRYFQTKQGDQLFSLATGCGVDETAYAAAYGKFVPNRPVLACGLVTDGWDAQSKLMNMKDRKYRRIRN